MPLGIPRPRIIFQSASHLVIDYPLSEQLVVVVARQAQLTLSMRPSTVQAHRPPSEWVR
jgi:hypothetical protein